MAKIFSPNTYNHTAKFPTWRDCVVPADQWDGNTGIPQLLGRPCASAPAKLPKKLEQPSAPEREAPKPSAPKAAAPKRPFRPRHCGNERALFPAYVIKYMELTNAEKRAAARPAFNGSRHCPCCGRSFPTAEFNAKYFGSSVCLDCYRDIFNLRRFRHRRAVEG